MRTRRRHGNPVVDFVARRLWWWMLWLMRRPLMKKWQRASWKVMPASRREQARKTLSRHNLFALRYGLNILRFTLSLFFASIVLTVVFMVVLDLKLSGAFEVR